MKQKESQYWQSIRASVARRPNGARLADILGTIDVKLPRRTLQYHLNKLVGSGHLQSTGILKGVRYSIAPDVKLLEQYSAARFVCSDSAKVQLAQIRRPINRRELVAFKSNFLEKYCPNVSRYLSTAEKKHLDALGQIQSRKATTWSAGQWLEGLSVKLSWNSSRLAGNAYSLLETRRLMHFGVHAESKTALDTQMILNHKEAIDFLRHSVVEPGFNRHTLFNLHAMLSDNLLSDPRGSGRLRAPDRSGGESFFMSESTYQPLRATHLMHEYFDKLLRTAQAIRHPYEQALFALVQLPYLQAFQKLNKQVSRLLANVPLIKHNRIPLNFTDVPQKTYSEAVLAVCELRKYKLLKELFIWACERSVEDFLCAQDTLVEPDAFCLRYREELISLVLKVVNQGLGKRHAYQYLVAWAMENIPTEDQVRFQEAAENSLLSLHEGNFARFRIRSAQFSVWQQHWSS